MHKTEVMKRPPPTTPSKREQRTVFCLSPSNEKRHCQCWGVLCINTDGLLRCCATHKSYLEADGHNWRQTERQRKGKKKRKCVSVWISSKLMGITVQELSELTAKCNLTGNRALWSQLLGLQFHCTLSNLLSWQKGERNIARGFDLAPLRCGAVYCHQLS